MKTFLFYTLVILTVTTTFAQNHAEIHTKSLKIENFIDYVAAQAINPIEQRIYIALEIGPNGLQAEERFYIEQGIKLLSKRVTENSLIAIGTYGSKSTIILPYSTLNAIKDISTIIAHAHKTSNPGATDGIDLAYETAELQIKEGVKNIVLILRNNSTQAALGTTTSPSNATAPQIPLEQVTKGKQAKIGGAIALTALTILPDILEIIKN
jgi:hypothetical protein